MLKYNSKARAALLAIGLVWMLVGAAFGQTITVTGKVVDKATNEGVPFCNVYNPDEPTQGVSTDLDGYYTLILPVGTKGIEVSAIGYVSQFKAVAAEPAEQELNFLLAGSSFDIEEVVLVAGEDPAMPIIRAMIAKRDELRLGKYDDYAFEQYNKTELDLKNIGGKFSESKAMKPFAFVFENIDSTSEAEPFLPTYIGEELVHVYHSTERKLDHQTLIGQKVSGIKNNTVVNFIDRLQIKYDAYDDFITIIDKPFASPFGKSGPAYYRYYLYDSLVIDGQMTYRIKFKPRRKQETTFDGYCWVAKDGYALVQYDMAMSEGVNINFVSRIKLGEAYGYDPEEAFWLPKQKNTLIEFEALENTPGMIGRVTHSYRDYRLGAAIEWPTDTRVGGIDFQLKELPDSVWTQKRHEKLTKNEAAIYSMMDSIQNVPAYKTYSEILYTLASGYWRLNKVELGPYDYIFGGNIIDGNSYRFGIRTTDAFNKKLRVGGYLNYGTRSQKLHHGIQITYLPNRNPRTLWEAEYVSDTDLNVSDGQDIDSGTISSSLLRRRDIVQKLMDLQQYSLRVERFLPNYFAVIGQIRHRQMDPYGSVFDNGQGFNYAYIPNLEFPNHQDTIVVSTEISVGLRYAFKEEYLEFAFSRQPIAGPYPVVQLHYTAGLKDVLGSQYAYHKLDFNMRYWFNVRAMGWTRFILRAGKTFGQAPFLLLDVPNGNETFLQAFRTFNAMNRFEFAADQYASLVVEHHFSGFLFNRIPLLRKLKWREVATFKAYMGSMRADNLARNAPSRFDVNNPSGYLGFMVPNRTPYMEAAVGIENIFKFVRIDAVFRLNYNDNPEALPFAIKGMLDFSF